VNFEKVKSKMSRDRREENTDCKVYVGGLPADATSQELEDSFTRYGPIRKVWIARRPPGFAFIEFEDNRDAEDAVRALDGGRVCGVRARVELSRGRRRGGGFRGRGGRIGGDRDGGRGYSRSRSPPPRRDSRYSPKRSRSPRAAGGGGGRNDRRRSPSDSPPPRGSPPRRSRSLSAD